MIAMQPGEPSKLLRMITNRTTDWVTMSDLSQWCIPVEFRNQWHTNPLDEAFWFLNSRLIRQLNWLGLIEVKRSDRHRPIGEQRIRKTMLFDEFLYFPTISAGQVGPIVVH